jgi:hypothetical protein
MTSYRVRDLTQFVSAFPGFNIAKAGCKLGRNAERYCGLFVAASRETRSLGRRFEPGTCNFFLVGQLTTLTVSVLYSLTHYGAVFAAGMRTGMGNQSCARTTFCATCDRIPVSELRTRRRLVLPVADGSFSILSNSLFTNHHIIRVCNLAAAIEMFKQEVFGRTTRLLSYGLYLFVFRMVLTLNSDCLPKQH